MQDSYAEKVHMQSPYPIIQCQRQASPPWGDKLPSLSHPVLNSLQAALELS